jgi:hypothetical protein
LQDLPKKRFRLGVAMLSRIERGQSGEEQIHRTPVQGIQGLLRGGHGDNLKPSDLQSPLERTPKDFVVVDKQNPDTHRAPRNAHEMPTSSSMLGAGFCGVPVSATPQIIGIRAGSAGLQRCVDPIPLRPMIGVVHDDVESGFVC